MEIATFNELILISQEIQPGDSVSEVFYPAFILLQTMTADPTKSAMVIYFFDPAKDKDTDVQAYLASMAEQVEGEVPIIKI